MFNQYPTYGNQAVDERIWVQNQAAAEAYLMAPNSFVRLWDANSPVFYEKRSDITGRPMPLEAYEYKRKAPAETLLQNSGAIDYQKEIDGILRRLEALEKGVLNEHTESNDNDSKV